MISEDIQIAIGRRLGTLWALMGWTPLFSYEDVVALVITKVGGFLLLSWIVLLTTGALELQWSFVQAMGLTIGVLFGLAVLDRVRR